MFNKFVEFDLEFQKDGKVARNVELVKELKKEGKPSGKDNIYFL